MLLAAGVECKADTIIPIVVDSDAANADLYETNIVVNDYIKINAQIPKLNNKNSNCFFGANMAFFDHSLFKNLKDSDGVFWGYLKRNEMTRSNKALIDALFSKDEQSFKMNQGFLGNSSMGSVVLNQLEAEEWYKNFTRSIQKEDKVFIVSSIFGGTGASGLTLLLKTLRMQNEQVYNWSLVNNATIGAVVLLPYFKVQDTNKVFIEKTKVSLSYYRSFDKELDAMYYIADNLYKKYERHEGGDKQTNPAHFVELAAALAILDFANGPIVRDPANPTTVYKEFGIKPSESVQPDGTTTVNDCKEMSFADMSDKTNEYLKKPLSQLFLFRKYLKEVFPKQNTHQPWSHNYPWKKSKNYDEQFMKSESMKVFLGFLDLYYTWLDEMYHGQERKFHPFVMDGEEGQAMDFVRYVKSKRSRRYRQWAWMDNELNKQIRRIPKELSKTEAFFELFYRATESFVNTLI